MENIQIMDKVTKYSENRNVIVVIEDIEAYNKRISKDVVKTCKFLGELEYRLKNDAQIPFELVMRNKVRRWIFGRFNDLCIERIDKRLAYMDNYGEKNGTRRYRNKDGDIRKASFHYVDDRIIIEAMKRLWNIPTPKPGKKNIYGFSKHSWQALALGSYWLSINDV